MRIISSSIIEQVAGPRLWTDVMELAFKALSDKDYFTPSRLQVNIEDNSLIWSSSIAPDICTSKHTSVFPNNNANNKSEIHSSILLNDSANGETLALLNGNKIMAMSTAAVACVGIRHLSDPLATSIGIIGAGEQGQHIAWLASEERDIERVYVFDPSFKRVQEFINFMTDKCPAIDVALCEDAQQVVVNSEIVVTATASTEPVIPNLEDLILGKCFICVGSYKPDMRELPDSVYRLIDHVWIDAEQSKTESGDLIYPLKNNLIKPEQIRHINSLLEHPTELGFRETRLFKTVGQEIFNLFASKLVYEKARENNLGLEVDL